MKRPSAFSPLSNQYQSSSTAVLELERRQKCVASHYKKKFHQGSKFIAGNNIMAGWRTNEFERERKNWTESCLLAPTLLLAPAKSRKPVSTWSVMEESLIPVVWLCSSLWCTCGRVEHFRRLLAQKCPCVVHMFTCFFSFLVSILLQSMFWYGNSFASNVQTPKLFI